MKLAITVRKFVQAIQHINFCVINIINSGGHYLTLVEKLSHLKANSKWIVVFLISMLAGMSAVILGFRAFYPQKLSWWYEMYLFVVLAFIIIAALLINI